MKKYTKYLLEHPLFTGSAVMVFGSNFYNLGQFIYHFLAGRLLGKVYYGDLAVMVSIIGLISVAQLSFNLTIVKFISSGKGREAISNLARWVNWWAIWIGLLFALSALVFSPFIIDFLNLTEPIAFYFLIPTLFFFVLLSTGRSILQGLLMFNKYVVSLLAEVMTKIILTIVLIFAGFSIFGATGAILAGTLAAYLVTRLVLSSYLQGKRGAKPNVAPLVKYSVPVFIQGLALTSMYSVDLVLVKHFFPAADAGLYAAAAMLGRVVFFSTTPIAHVMFPLVSRRYSHGSPYHSIFYLSVLLVSLAAVAVVLFYIFFPEFAIMILYGAGFLGAAGLVWWFGVFMGLLSLAMLFTQFYLSIGKTKIVWLFVVAAVLQAVLIWFIHPDLLTVIQISIASTALLVLSLLVYFLYHHGKEK